MAIGEVVRGAALIPEVLRLRRLRAVIAQALPEELRPHCHSGRIEAGTLVLFAGSPVWAARLRYSTPVLLERLAGSTPAIRAIRVRVLVPGSLPPVESRPGRTLSRPASDYLESAAEGCGDARLRAVLLRLSRHGPGPA